MKYFDFFEITPSFSPDKNLVQKKYFELSRKYHPDLNRNLSAKEQDEMMNKATLLNEVYKVLQDEMLLLEYILKEKNKLADDEKFVLPQSFLMEMMDWNETIEELKTENNTEEILRIANEKKSALTKPVEHLLSQNINELSDEEWLLLKEYFYKQKYLQKILRS